MLEAFLVQSDDTTIKVLDSSHPKNIRLGYFWFYIGDHKIAYVNFTPGRPREGPIKIMKPRKTDFLQTDDYAGSERLYNGKEASLTNVGCWMHARRYLYELKDYKSLPVLEKIKELYKIEENCKDLDFDAHMAIRPNSLGMRW